MSDATFLPPDLGSFCRLDELGLQVVGQRLEPGRAVLAWRVVEPTSSPGGVPLRMPGCAARQRDPAAGARTAGVAPDDVADHVRRYRCTGCGHVSRQDTSRAAEPRAKLSRRALRWALEGIVCQHLTVARVAEGLGVSWNTANDAVLAEGRRVLIEDPHRFDGVRVIGVDEHCWRHTRRGDKYVTVIIDLTPIRDGTGPARLLDMVEGRSKQVFKTWLGEPDRSWRDGVEVVAMDGFTGFKTATSEELPDAVAVMTRSTSCAWPAMLWTSAAAASSRSPVGTAAARATRSMPRGAPSTRRRAAHREAASPSRSPVRGLGARRGRGDLGHLPAHDRRLPRTRQEAWQGHDAGRDRLRRQRRPGHADRDPQARPDPQATRHRHPRALRPARHVERPHRGINGRLEHLRGSALGFRNLTNYIARSLLEAGGFRPRRHPRLR